MSFIPLSIDASDDDDDDDSWFWSMMDIDIPQETDPDADRCEWWWSQPGMHGDEPETQPEQGGGTADDGKAGEQIASDDHDQTSGVDMDPVSKAFVYLKALEEIFEQKYPVVYDSGRDFLKEIEAMDLDQMDIDRLSTYQVRLRRPQTTAPNASGNDYEDYPFSPFSDDMDQVDVAGMLAQRVVFTTCL